MQSQPWEGIAFIALYDRESKTILHSQKGLIRTSPDDPTLGESIKSSISVIYLKERDRGNRFYIMAMPTQIYEESSVPLLLRISLSTEHARGSLTHAKAHALTALVIIAFLWILTLGVVNCSRKVIALHMKEMEKRHFTMLGEMATVLAREITSPLSAIKGFAHYIYEMSGNNVSTEEGLDVIITESQRLERLTEDLLVYARVSKVNAAKFSLSELVDEVEGLFMTYEKDVTIIFRRVEEYKKIAYSEVFLNLNKLNNRFLIIKLLS